MAHPGLDNKCKTTQITNNNTKKGKKMANKINHKSSQVLMKTPSGYEHMFESIEKAASFAKANSWTMALKMQVKGYFEDDQGNKYYRQDEMKTKNEYTTASAKMIKKIKPKQKRKRPIRVDGRLFNSIAEASRFYHFDPDVIARYLKKGKNTYKGYHIEYSNMNEIEKLMNTNKMPKRKNAIPVYVDGVFYENCAKAAKALNIHKSSISAYLGWGRREINGHKIETVEEHKNNIKETFQTPQIPQMPKAEIKDENISVVIDSTDPAIKAINERIVELLKQSGIYDEVKKLSQAIQKLSK